LRRALQQTFVPGLVTNREQLIRILAHPAFLAGELHTHFLEEHAGELAAHHPGLDKQRVAAIAATLANVRAPALAPAGWRNVPVADQTIVYKLGAATEIPIGYHPTASGGFTFAIGGKTTEVTAYGRDGDHLWFVEYGVHRRTVRIAQSGPKIWILSEGELVLLVEEPRFPDVLARAVAGGLVAPMPGKVVKVLVTDGQEVTAGTALVVLEAMKMEHTVRATTAGVVRELVTVGQQVDGDQVLAVVTEPAA